MISETKLYTLEEAADLIADRQATKVHENLILQAAEGAIARRQELLEQAKNGGAVKVDAAMANAIASETLRQAREELSQQILTGVFLPSEIKAIDKISRSNVETVAALYYPEAYKAIEQRRHEIGKKAIANKAKERRLSQREARVKDREQKLKDAISKARDKTWREKLWFWKELTSNVLVIQVVIAIGLIGGIWVGIQVPEGAVCEKGGICSIFRIREKRIY